MPVTKGYPIDMGHLFRSWYLWAFWGCIFNLIAIVTLLSLYIYRKDLRHILRLVTGSIAIIVVCSNMLWYLLGTFWRFSKAGRVASAERLTRTDSMVNQEWQNYLEYMSEASGYQLVRGRFMGLFIIISMEASLAVIRGIGIALASVT